MTPPPIPCVWDGEAFRPVLNFLRVAREHYGEGEVIALVPREDRSAASHRHFMACVNEAWKTLPDDLAERFKSAEHLRKFSLIQTGHYDVAVYACKFQTEARRMAATLTDLDAYAVIVVDGVTVTRLTAKSQSYYAMNRKEFGKAKEDVLAYIETLLDVPAGTLAKQREAA
jgi:hypothetical protein